MVVLENERRSITSSNCVERSLGKSSNVKHDHVSHIPHLAPVVVICERCHWCATYLDTDRILQEEKVDDDNNKICPRCDTIDSLSSLFHV
jgi:C4-type Zn-finger protein